MTGTGVHILNFAVFPEHSTTLTMPDGGRPPISGNHQHVRGVAVMIAAKNADHNISTAPMLMALSATLNAG